MMSEKEFLTKMGISLMSIILCLVALSVSAWAFFGENTAASTQILEAACFDVQAQVKKGEEVVAVVPETAHRYSIVPGSYTIDLSKSAEEAVTATGGYCKLKFWEEGHLDEEPTVFYSRYINQISTELQPTQWTITLTTNKNLIMQIVPVWGSCSIEPTDAIDLGTPPPEPKPEPTTAP